jgi:Papain family cysteine protease
LLIFIIKQYEIVFALNILLMLRITTLLVFCACFLFGSAQKPATGLMCSDERYKQVPVLPAYTGVKFNDIPIKVSLRKYCPVAGNQYRIGACVGWAVGYNALTILRAVHANVTDKALITQKANSAAFVYNQVRLESETDCNQGAYIEDALQLLQNRGDCLESTFNYGGAADCRSKPEAGTFTEAIMYRIRDYAAVFPAQEIGKNKVSNVCKVLATKTPVVIGMGITKSFLDVLPGQKRWDPTPEEAIDSYHAMVVVGYDNVEKHFEVLNSFGSAWGKNGLIEVKFDDFERLCRYAYVMTLENSGEQAFSPVPTAATPDSKPVAEDLLLSGAFVFRQPSGSAETPDGHDVFLFEEVPTRWIEAEGVYTTGQSQFAVGDVFQLLAREIPKGRYAYVFSQNPEGVVNLHFPKTNATADFFLDETAEIVLPEEDKVLQLSTPGDDHLCILYSYQKINDIETRLAALERAPAAFFQEKIKRVFGDLLIAPDQLQYNPSAMDFTAKARPDLGKVAVPVILRVRAK